LVEYDLPKVGVASSSLVSRSRPPATDFVAAYHSWVASNVLASRLVDIGDTQLHVVEKGSGFPLLIFHGGPGLDHHMFGDYLDPLADDFRLVLVDQRSQGRSARAPESTWSLGQMAADVNSLARALNLGEYATLGHSFGAFVVLQHAVEYPGQAARTIVSGGLPSSRYLSHVQENLAAFEPADLRNQVTASWEREKEARTHDDVVSLLRDQLPFQFGDPFDPRIKEYERRTSGAFFPPTSFVTLPPTRPMVASRLRTVYPACANRFSFLQGRWTAPVWWKGRKPSPQVFPVPVSLSSSTADT
jgi:pimeloyl-ACP methyl ester carboxylesterase